MRVLLVEDNRRLAELLTTGLRRAGWTVDVVDSLDAALAACRGIRFDAVLLDRGLPDGDGLALLGALRAGPEAPAILVMTARGTVPDRVEGLNRGADDYIVKPVAMEELVARLNAAIRRSGALRPAPVRCGGLAYDPVSRAITAGGRPFDPPRRERMLLEALLNAAPRPVAKEYLEERLDSFDRAIGRNAVEVYVHRLRRRLAESGVGATIETVRGLGYRLAAEAPAPGGQGRPSGAGG
ncbi:response regulator transcription factor [Crenalkalicoccus roseus]|uniref:response regulator transcription factor n=1 Tax=Crenalkalicoccus roseus TaxID=1485588 RepID=UPI0010806569|nr:response regulator transcription factor [Crenalkalicoccus roseus]